MVRSRIELQKAAKDQFLRYIGELCAWGFIIVRQLYEEIEFFFALRNSMPNDLLDGVMCSVGHLICVSQFSAVGRSVPWSRRAGYCITLIPSLTPHRRSQTYAGL